MSNRLVHATSPYLLQHADNPVDWYEWGDDAFTEARRRDVPIFLSIGYATCHWCHVMAHESFEDHVTAQVLNDRFVSIKVDREERPDVDAVYMAALQAFSGHGGWPMSVFLNHDLAPFYAGTYWPKTPRHGAPTFLTVLDAISDAWSKRQAEIAETAEAITAAIQQADADTHAETVDLTVADDAAELLVSRAYDRTHGGFGRAPKFPYAMTLDWLLAYANRTQNADAHTAATHSLEAMARGGIYDLVDDGFARYATDERWLVPHFEKMLYDNALLLPAYATAYQHTGRDVFLRTAEGIGRWLATMQDASGGFYSAVDADSEGHEGRFAVFTYREFADVVDTCGEEPALFARFFGVTEDGNFEGRNVLSEPVDRDTFALNEMFNPDMFRRRLADVTTALRTARQARPQPIVDTKILTDLNGLAIRSLIRAGTVLNWPAYLAMARRCGDFLVATHLHDGALWHSSIAGRRGVTAFASDYAAFANAALHLFAIDGDTAWLARAITAATTAYEQFADPTCGDYFTTARDATPLLIRPKDTWDNATPSATSVMTETCLLLAEITGDNLWRTRAEQSIRAFQPRIQQNPAGYGFMLRQYETLAQGLRTCVIIGDDTPARDALVRTAHQQQTPGLFTVVTATPDDNVALFTGRKNTGNPTAYVCRNTVCEQPVHTPTALRELL